VSQLFDHFKTEMQRKIASLLIGHPSATLVHYHLWNKKDYPNLWDYATYSGKQVDLATLNDMCVRKRSMWDKTTVQNWSSILQAAFVGVTNSVTDTGGASRSVPVPSASVTTIFRADAASADSTYGVVAGSSNQAFARTDTKLISQVAHGVTSTTLSHGASSTSAVTNPSGNINRIQHQRSLTGNAGSTVNMQEDGLYLSVGSGGFKICVARNLNAFGAVSAAQVVTITRNWDSPTT